MVLRVVGWNVRQGGGTKRSPGIVAALHALGANVVVVSEHRATGAGRLSERLHDGGWTFQLGGIDPAGSHAGLLIASDRPLTQGELVFPDEADGHRLTHTRVDGWELLGAYLPVGGAADLPRKQACWRYIVDVAEPFLRDRRALLIGDLNTGLHYRDELGATFTCSEEMAVLYQRGWVDGWVSLNPTRRPPASWWSPQPHSNPFRLDHALLSPSASRPIAVTYRQVLPDGTELCGAGALSDHAALEVDLR